MIETKKNTENESQRGIMSLRMWNLQSMHYHFMEHITHKGTIYIFIMRNYQQMHTKKQYLLQLFQVRVNIP